MSRSGSRTGILVLVFASSLTVLGACNEKSSVAPKAVPSAASTTLMLDSQPVKADESKYAGKSLKLTATAGDVCECNGGDKCCCPSGYTCCNSPGTCCCDKQ